MQLGNAEPGLEDNGAPTHKPAPLSSGTRDAFLFVCFESEFLYKKRPQAGSGRRLPGPPAAASRAATRHPTSRAFGVMGRRPSRGPLWASEAVGPAHVAGGPGHPHRQPPHKGGQGKPRTPQLPRGPRAQRGRRKVPEPARLVGEGRGEGNADPRARRVAAGTPTPLGSSIQSSLPAPETSAPEFGCPSRGQRDRDPTPLTRGRHFLAFLLVLSTSVSLSRSP